MKLITLALITLIFCTPCFSNYPAHWWTSIDDAKAPSWEVLPQSGENGKTVILSKRNELGILSNFAPTPFVYEKKKYASMEGAWQSMKYPENKNDRRYGRDSLPYSRGEVEKMSSFEAKRAGSLASKLMKKHQINFVTYKGKKMKYRSQAKGEHYDLIVRMMKEKLKQNPKVQLILKSTGKLILLPDHHTKKDSPPAWKYHQIWMELRERL